MAVPARFERATGDLRRTCSIQLSYGTVIFLPTKDQPDGLEPAHYIWRGVSQCYTRSGSKNNFGRVESFTSPLAVLFVRCRFALDSLRWALGASASSRSSPPIYEILSFFWLSSILPSPGRQFAACYPVAVVATRRLQAMRFPTRPCPPCCRQDDQHGLRVDRLNNGVRLPGIAWSIVGPRLDRE